MPHRRLRKFNTKKTYPEQKLDNDLCMSVRAKGTFVFLRGQVGQDLDGRMVGIGDPAAQTEQAMKNVKVLLEEQGARLEDICKITIFITDRAYREPVYRSLRELALSYFNSYFNLRRERTLRRYSVPVNLKRFDRQNWMTTDQPVWFIVYHLFDIKHYPLLTKAQEKRLHRIDERLFQAECLGKAYKTRD